MSKVMKKSKVKLEAQVAEKLALLNETENIKEIIKDNKIEFTVNEKKYRVSKPTNTQSIAIRKTRNLEFFRLLKDPAYKLKEVLIEEIKEEGYDIIAKEVEIKEIGLQIEDISEKVAVIPTESKEVIENYKKEVEELLQKQSKISGRITELMEFSVEQTLEEFSNLMLIYSVLEKEIEDKSIDTKEGDDYPKKWINAFDSYTKFLDSDEEVLLLEATYNMSMLVFKSRIQ